MKNVVSAVTSSDKLFTLLIVLVNTRRVYYNVTHQSYPLTC